MTADVGGAPERERAVRLRAVRKSFREGRQERGVLRGADLDLPLGDCAALVGPSGSGKTTLLNLIAGMDVPDAGSIEVAGRRVDGMDERERTLLRRRHVGFVFQFFNLLPTLTVLENLLLPLELTGELGASGRERARSLLEEVGLGDRSGTFPDRLSGGERQRVAIARALVHRPALILADEPTGTLDRSTGDRVADLLLATVRSRGGTLLLVTHSNRLAARADRVLRMVEGRVEVEEPART